MQDKISPGHFRTIYKELTGDCSASDNKIPKDMEEKMQLILSISDDIILKISMLITIEIRLLMVFLPSQKEKLKKCRPLPSMTPAMLRRQQSEK